jgi:hypothetical protein
MAQIYTHMADSFFAPRGSSVHAILPSMKLGISSFFDIANTGFYYKTTKGINKHSF